MYFLIVFDYFYNTFHYFQTILISLFSDHISIFYLAFHYCTPYFTIFTILNYLQTIFNYSKHIPISHNISLFSHHIIIVFFNVSLSYTISHYLYTIVHYFHTIFHYHIIIPHFPFFSKSISLFSIIFYSFFRPIGMLVSFNLWHKQTQLGIHHFLFLCTVVL